MKTYIFLLGILTITLTSFIYAPANNQTKTTTTIFNSKAFIISEHEGLVENLEKTYTETLLSSCNNDVDIAFDAWKSLGKDINAFANYNNMSLSGVKIWVKAFYSKNGQIEYLGYDVRKTSKRVNRKQFNKMLNQFIELNDKKLDNATENFTHFGSISFK